MRIGKMTKLGSCVCAKVLGSKSESLRRLGDALRSELRAGANLRAPGAGKEVPKLAGPRQISPGVVGTAGVFFLAIVPARIATQVVFS
jgi:hypothetical protein